MPFGTEASVDEVHHRCQLMALRLLSTSADNLKFDTTCGTSLCIVHNSNALFRDLGLHPTYFDLHCRLFPVFKRAGFVVVVKIESYEACQSRQVTQEMCTWLNLIVQQAPTNPLREPPVVLLAFTHRDKVEDREEEDKICMFLQALIIEARSSYGSCLDIANDPEQAPLWVCGQQWRRNNEVVTKRIEELGVLAMKRNQNVAPRSYRLALAHIKDKRESLAAKQFMVRSLPIEALKTELAEACNETDAGRLDDVIAFLEEHGHIVTSGVGEAWVDPVHLLTDILPKFAGPNELDSVVQRFGLL